MISIFAGAIHRVQFRPGTDASDGADVVKDEFVPVGDPGATGPVFKFRTLNYFEYQDIFGGDGEVADKVRKAFELALVSIDDSDDSADRFRASPSSRIAPALFNAIYEASAGN